LLQIDADGWATDEDTGLPPEQLPPPYFVTAEGNMHSEKDQRLVPGNDILSDVSLKTKWRIVFSLIINLSFK
jgi:hypothetical protein